MDQDDDSYITPDLCEAYRKTVETKIDGVTTTLTEKINGLRSTIIVGISISTAVISIVMWLLQARGG